MPNESTNFDGLPRIAMRCEKQALDSRAAVVIAALMIWLTPWTVRQLLGPGLIDSVLFIAVGNDRSREA